MVQKGGGENRKCQLIHISKCHVIPGVFSLCHHLHPPPACHLEDRLQGSWWGDGGLRGHGLGDCISALPLE